LDAFAVQQVSGSASIEWEGPVGGLADVRNGGYPPLDNSEMRGLESIDRLRNVRSVRD
jgi:hypothetical protein